SIHLALQQRQPRQRSRSHRPAGLPRPEAFLALALFEVSHPPRDSPLDSDLVHRSCARRSAGEKANRRITYADAHDSSSRGSTREAREAPFFKDNPVFPVEPVDPKLGPTE